MELRPQFVEKYVSTLIKKDADPELYKKRFEVVKKMMEL